MKRIVISCIILITTLFSLWAETGREIIESVINGEKSESSATEIEMKLVDKAGNVSTRRLQSLTIEDDGRTKSITIFMEPASIRNTRFLTFENESRNDDQWIYLPALRKVKRIASGDKDASFMGTDFSYADLSSGTEFLDKNKHILLKEENFKSFDCFVVESIPNAEINSSYGKKISWVDKKSRTIIRMQYFSKNRSRIVKELIRDNIRLEQGYWSGFKSVMTTMDTGHKTIIEVKKIKYDIPINIKYFTRNFLQTGRVNS